MASPMNTDSDFLSVEFVLINMCSRMVSLLREERPPAIYSHPTQQNMTFQPSPLMPYEFYIART